MKKALIVISFFVCAAAIGWNIGRAGHLLGLNSLEIFLASVLAGGFIGFAHALMWIVLIGK